MIIGITGGIPSSCGSGLVDLLGRGGGFCVSEDILRKSALLLIWKACLHCTAMLLRSLSAARCLLRDSRKDLDNMQLVLRWSDWLPLSLVVFLTTSSGSLFYSLSFSKCRIGFDCASSAFDALIWNHRSLVDLCSCRVFCLSSGIPVV